VTFFLSLTTYAQSAKEMLEEINGKWALDDNGNVTVMKIIEVPELKKDEIYNRVLNYFTYNYTSGKSVIQTQDKENGLVVGKGLYINSHVGISFVTTYVSTWHILRVDVQDGRFRVIVSLVDYDKTIVGGSTGPLYSSLKISQCYPVNQEGGQKTVMTKAFYNSFKLANNTLDRVEKAVKDGSTSKAIENSKW
jgi:hypothetical protein